MRALLFSLCLSLVLPLPSRAVEVGDEPRLPDLVLTPRNFQALSAESQVGYLKFYLNFLATIEEMQDATPSEKNALLVPARGLFFELLATDPANAQDLSDLEGQPCINALNLSTWAVSSRTNRLYCRRVPAPDCGGGRRGCGQEISKFTPGLGPVCVPGDSGDFISAKCVEAMMEKAGDNVSDFLHRGARSGVFEHNAPQFKAGLMKFHEHRYGSMSVREYCATQTGANAIQHRECAKMNQLVDGFDAGVVGNQDPYDRRGHLKNTPEMHKYMQNIQVVRRAHRENPCESHTYAHRADSDVLFVPTNCNTRQPRRLHHRSTRKRYRADYPPTPVPPPGDDEDEPSTPRTMPWYGPSPDPEEPWWSRILNPLAGGNGGNSNSGHGNGGNGGGGNGGNGGNGPGGGPGGGGSGGGPGGGGSGGGPGGGGSGGGPGGGSGGGKGGEGSGNRGGGGGGGTSGGGKGGEGGNATR